MKILHSWLLDFVATDKSPRELADVLTNTGTEVTTLHTSGFSDPNVVVGRILSSEKHPSADRLSVCRVLTREDEEPRQIVCGAKNYKVGDLVPVALPGAVLPGNFTIKKSRLRGVESEGMMCSAKELALAEDAEGLMILPQNLPLGARVDSLFPSDTVYDIEVTSNRPDLLSHHGVARELVAAGAAQWKDTITIPSEVTPIPNTGDEFKIKNYESAFCTFYSATIFEGVENQSSPDWMQRRLIAVGLRPINAAVDVTNYLLHHIGQPMHVFDLDKLSGSVIVIRRAKEGEILECLDGSSVTLGSEDFVIADHDKPLALAGVVGGKNSSVELETRKILLEVAHFEPKAVRFMSQRHKISTDSSYRFERGTDPLLPQRARTMACSLFREILGIQPSGGSEFDAGVRKKTVVTLRNSRVARLLGKNISCNEIRNALCSLGLEQQTDQSNSDQTVWSVPTNRPDLNREVDLIEEIARLTPFDTIPSVTEANLASSSKDDRLYDQIFSIKQTLVGLGWHEVLTAPLVERPDSKVLLSNPMSCEQEGLRKSLLPQLLRILSHNLDAGNVGCKLFMIEKIFPEAGLEKLSLALAVGGINHEDHWAEDPRIVDVFDLKAALNNIGYKDQHKIEVLTPAQSKTWGIKGIVACTEVELPKSVSAPHRYKAWSAYPSVRRDLCVVVNKTRTASELTQAIRESLPELLERVWVFDVFTDPSGTKVPAGCKSISIALRFRAKDRTLTDQEISQGLNKVLEVFKRFPDLVLRK